MSDTEVATEGAVDGGATEHSEGTQRSEATQHMDGTAETDGTVNVLDDDAAIASEGGAVKDAVEDAASGESAADDANALLVQEGDIAADYLERLLDIVDYDGDIDLDVENDRAIVAIVGTDLRALVGERGETLDALQELTRLAVQQKTGLRSRLMLDVSGHRQARRDQLGRLASETATQVIESGEPQRLAPMNPFERKVVHDTISAIDGVRSESDGEEPNRRVVVLIDG